MDRNPRLRELEVLMAAIDAGRALGLKIELFQDETRLTTAADALLQIQFGGEELRYVAEVRQGLGPATLGAALIQLERIGDQALLIADYVNPVIARQLKARHINFLDAAGNANLERPPLLIWVTGQKPTLRNEPEAINRAFRPTGLQVVFILLCNPQAVNRPYRELAEMAGVAHGTVGWVVPDLQRMGFIGDLKGKKGTRRLFDRERLLQLWTDAYARLLRPKTLIGLYYVPTLDNWKHWPIAKHGGLWGGEPAGALLTDHLRPGGLTIYAEKLPGQLAAQQRFLKEPAAGHKARVEVRRRFWRLPVDRLHPAVVPPTLVYADLLATGDARCIETAKIVHEAYVARLLQQD